MTRLRSTALKRRTSRFLSEDAGVSLVELLVGIGIAAGIMTLIGTFIFQFFSVTRVGTNRMAVSSDLQSAALWLGRDTAQAHTYSDGSPPEYGRFLAELPDGEHEFRYLYDSDKGHLMREHYRDSVLQSTLVVARFIDTEGDVAFSTGGSLVSVSIASTSGDASETLQLELALRDETP